MASTRNKNMPGEYCLRQMSNMHSTNFMTYHGAALNKTNLLPCAGVLHGKVPNTVLSENSTSGLWCELFPQSNLPSPLPFDEQNDEIEEMMSDLYRGDKTLH